MKVKVALVQMNMVSDIEVNRKKAVDAIAKAKKLGANIVCLPEIFTSPYFPQEERADAEAYAEQIPGITSDLLSKAAKENNMVIIGGSIFEKDGKHFYNTSVVFDQNGKILGKYRKVHIPHDPNFYEQNYFEAGDLGYNVFKTSFGKIAVLICYDQWFPEAARINALSGADIIFYPTAIGRVAGVEESEGNWQKAWEDVQRGHAIANGIIVAAVNRVGKEKNTTFWGGSFISDAFGGVLAHGGEKEEIIIAECDLDHGKRVKEGWRFFYNRRPETYKKLLEK